MVGIPALKVNENLFNRLKGWPNGGPLMKLVKGEGVSHARALARLAEAEARRDGDRDRDAYALFLSCIKTTVTDNR
jgi:hypothetical protein